MFHTLSHKLLTRSLDIIVSNLEVEQDHWRSFGAIREMAEELEMILYPHSTFKEAEKEIIDFLLKFNKRNPRINNIQFYNDGQSYICLCISDMATFKPENFLKRSITFDFCKQKKKMQFVDITADEWNSIELQMPINWHFNGTLTEKYNKYKKLFT